MNVVHRSGYKAQQRIPKLVIRGVPHCLSCPACFSLFILLTHRQYTPNEARPLHLLESSTAFIFYKQYKYNMKSTKVQTLGAYRTASPAAAGVYQYACEEIGHASLAVVDAFARALIIIVKRDHRLAVDGQSWCNAV